ncbi:hypothetical protein [Streptomyces sp. NPDC002490]|uniref:hypothetical protein n=1 Tax=Streptomyces sp. NPDC002490 TaxID=3154416 RepID=UPI003316FAA1
MGCDRTPHADHADDDPDDPDSTPRGGPPAPADGGLAWIAFDTAAPAPTGPLRAPDVTVDRRWTSDRRDAVCCALALLALVGLVDVGNGSLTPARAALWALLALLLYGVLHPSRVTAGPGWLAVRGLWRTRRVATDLLVSVRHGDGLQPRLVLRDALGNRLEVDPKVLSDNPLIWHRLDTGARHARANGLLRTGTTVLQGMGKQWDATEARAVFEVSHLD